MVRGRAGTEEVRRLIRKDLFLLLFAIFLKKKKRKKEKSEKWRVVHYESGANMRFMGAMDESELWAIKFRFSL